MVIKGLILVAWVLCTSASTDALRDEAMKTILEPMVAHGERGNALCGLSLCRSYDYTSRP